MPRQNPCGCLPGHRCMCGSAVWEQASQRVIERRKQLGTGSLPQGLYPRTFTSGSLLGGQRGLDFLDDGIQHLQIEVHTQLQSTRRNEIGHGGKFSHVERVFVAHVWVAALTLHRRVTGQSSPSSRSSSTSNGDSTSPRQASRPSRTASTATTSAATESAHHQPNRLSRTRPMNTAPER